MDLATRKYILQSSRSFSEYARAKDYISASGGSEGSMLDIILIFSRKCRSLLKELNTEINKLNLLLAESNSDDPIVEILESEYDLCSDILFLWHICEMFVLNPSNQICIEIIEWLQDVIEDFDPILMLVLESQFSRSTSPELNDDEQKSEFWESVTSLCLRGRFFDAWKILSYDPILTEISRSVSGFTNEDRKFYSELERAFATHPIAILTSSKAQYEPDYYANSFNIWQANVYKLWSSGYQLLAKLPELEPLLCLFSGDARTISRYCLENNFSWQEVALCKLLFSNEIPHTRIQLAQFMEHCLLDAQISQRGDNSMVEENEITVTSDVKRNMLLRDVIRGDAGPVLSCLHRRSLTSCPSKMSQLVHAVSVAHLGCLLQSVGALEDTQFPSSSSRHLSTSMTFELSYGRGLEEEFLLYAAECLSGSPLRLPPEIILEYCCATSPSSVHGRYFASTLLRRLPCRTDAEVEQVTHCLYKIGMIADAESVVLTRGMWWSQRGNLKKAMYYFIRSGETGSTRCTLLLEQQLMKCMSAVMHSSYFPGLFQDFGNLCTMSTTAINNSSSNNSHQIDLFSVLRETSALLSGYTSHEKLLAIKETTYSGSGGRVGSSGWWWLYQYQQAIEKILAISDTINSDVDISSIYDDIRSIKDILYNLVITPTTITTTTTSMNTSTTTFPVRFRLHIIDLLLWFAATVQNATEEESSTGGRRRGAVDVDDRDRDMAVSDTLSQGQTATQRQWDGDGSSVSVLSQIEVERLIRVVQHTTTTTTPHLDLVSHLIPAQTLNDSSSSSGGGRDLAVGGSSSLHFLRISLLEALVNAAIYENRKESVVPKKYSPVIQERSSGIESTSRDTTQLKAGESHAVSPRERDSLKYQMKSSGLSTGIKRNSAIQYLFASPPTFSN